MERESIQVGDSIGSPFELLSHRYRRFAVRVLDDHGQELALADLADEVAQVEYDSPITEIPAEEVSSLYLSLYHSHVPKLCEADVVEYEQERDIVIPEEELSELARVVSLVSPAED